MTSMQGFGSKRLPSIRMKFFERDKSLPSVDGISSTQLVHKDIENTTFASQQFRNIAREELGQAISPETQLKAEKREPPTSVALNSSGHTGKVVPSTEIMARKARGRPGPSQSQSSLSNPHSGGKSSTTHRMHTISGSQLARRRPVTLLRRKRAGGTQMNMSHSTSADYLVSQNGKRADETTVSPDEEQECERQASRQVPSWSASPSHEGQKSNARRKLHNIIQRAKSQVILLRDKTLRRKRLNGEETNEQEQLAAHSPIIRHEEALMKTTYENHPAAMHRTEGDAPDMKLAQADTLCAEVNAGDPEEVQKLRQDLSNSRFQVAELQRRCEAQSKELQGSSVFFSTADKSSDFDVIRACQRLNAELQQNTTYMAECLKEAFEFQNPVVNPMAEQITAVQRISDHIGPVLTNGLTDSTPANLTMLLQIAFQARLASALSLAASSWALEPGHNTFIYGIYQRLRSVEAQAISGHWRVLARVHTCNWNTQPESLVAGIIADFSDILSVAGCTTPHSDITSKVTSKFKDTLASLVELAIRLGQMFDDVVSSDFEVFLPRPGERFEDNVMEDVDGDQVVTPETLILCATNLGLIKRVPVGASLWVKGRKEKITVLKPQVLLESSLDAE